VNANSAGSDTSFATAIGGGVDYRLFRAVAWRFQGDYLQTRFFDTTAKQFAAFDGNRAALLSGQSSKSKSRIRLVIRILFFVACD